jgi:hypothetical protein
VNDPRTKSLTNDASEPIDSQKRSLDRSVASTRRGERIVARVPHDAESDVREPDVGQLVLEDLGQRRGASVMSKMRTSWIV